MSGVRGATRPWLTRTRRNLESGVAQAGRLRFSLPEIFAAGVRALQTEQAGSHVPSSAASAAGNAGAAHIGLATAIRSNSLAESVAATPATNESATNLTPGVEELDRFERCVTNRAPVAAKKRRSHARGPRSAVDGPLVVFRRGALFVYAHDRVPPAASSSTARKRGTSRG